MMMIDERFINGGHYCIEPFIVHVYIYTAGADLGNYGWVGAISRDEVPSGGWVCEGGCPPSLCRRKLKLETVIYVF